LQKIWSVPSEVFGSKRSFSVSNNGSQGAKLLLRQLIMFTTNTGHMQNFSLLQVVLHISLKMPD